MSARLRIDEHGGEHPGPRRVVLGADAWQVLVADARGLRFPAPFRPQDGPDLHADQRASATAALRGSGVAPGDSGDLLADLHPSIRGSLALHGQPLLAIDRAIGLGDDRRVARFVARGPLASGVARDVTARAGGFELGPVELLTLALDDLAATVVDGFGDLDGDPQREALQLDAAVSLTVVRALQTGREDLARAALDRPEVPAPLARLAAGLERVARVDVHGPQGTRVLVAMRLGDGWWMAGIDGEDVHLQPVGEDELVTEVVWILADLLSALGPIAS